MKRFWFVSVSIVVIVCSPIPADEFRGKETVTVKFKIFDTNEPTKRLNPSKTVSNFVRDPVTRKPVLLQAVTVSRPGGKDAFDEVQISKGWLIEQLVIQIDDPEKDYNPAFVTKLVTAADMTIYPGASRSTDTFAFQAYVAQLASYRTLLAQLLDEVDSAIREQVRSDMRAAFGRQLRNMADITSRLPAVKQEERTAAYKALNEVLKLYGMAYADEPVLAACPPIPGGAATIFVRLPPDARVDVDGESTASTGSTRSFTTPRLPPGGEFVYTLRATLSLNGRTMAEEVRVPVRPSHVTAVYFFGGLRE